MIGISLANNTT